MSLTNLAQDIVFTIQGSKGDDGQPGADAVASLGIFKVGNTTIGTNSVSILPQSSNDSKLTYTQVGNELIPVGYNANGASSFGSAICMSVDCLTLAVGGKNDWNKTNTNRSGSVWIYTRTSTSLPWTQVTTGLPVGGNKIQANDSYGNPLLGTSLSMSDDGNTLAVGGPSDINAGVFSGATFVFVRTAGVWSQQGSKLDYPSIDGARYANCGQSVSLSSNGNVLAVGCPTGHSSGTGAVIMYTRSGGTWTFKSLLNNNYNTTSGQKQGQSVSLSGDGKTLAVGCPNIETTALSNVGGVCIYKSTDLNSWSLVLASSLNPSLPSTQHFLRGTGFKLSDYQLQGTCVALSKDATTLVIGAPGAPSVGNGLNNSGCCWVFTQSGGVWTETAGPLVGTGMNKNKEQEQGKSLAISLNCDTIAIGGPSATTLVSGNYNVGATWIWKNSGTKWYQYCDPLQGANKSDTKYLYEGASICLSSDGTKLLTGSSDNSIIGSVFYYEAIPYSNTTNYQGSESVAIGAFAGVTSQAATIGYYPGIFSSLTGNQISGEGTTHGFGASSAISGDGSTMAASCGRNGGTYLKIYIMSSGVWSLQTKLTVGTYTCVSLSENGNTLAVGQKEINGYYGSGQVLIYVRSGTTWTLQQTIVDTYYPTTSATQQGYSVSLSSDGNTVAFGAPSPSLSGGVFFIWKSLQGVWSRDFVSPNNNNIFTQYGFSIALSGDGNSVVVGGPSWQNSPNAFAHYYVRTSAGNWLVYVIPVQETGNNLYFGSSVAISKDGRVIAIGQVGANSQMGRTQIYYANGYYTPTFSQSIQDTTSDTVAYQGNSVSMSSDGNILCVGAIYDDSSNGVVRIYKKDKISSPYTLVAKLKSLTTTGGSNFGASVSISHDGTSLVVGGDTHGPNQTGAVWTFSSSSVTGSSIAIGSQAGSYKQSSGSVALGHRAGEMNQGAGSLAIGYQAGQLNQPANSTFIAKLGIRMINSTYKYCQYDPSSGEISFCPSGFSDQRLKSNISDADPDTLREILKQVQLKKFSFIDKSQSINRYGVIANDVAKITNLGEQTVKKVTGFIPNLFLSSTFDCLDKEKNVILSTVEMVDSPPIVDENGVEMKMPQTERVVEITGAYLKIKIEDSNDKKKLLKVGDKIRFFTFPKDVIPLDLIQKDGCEEVDGMDHQEIILSVDEEGVTVLNSNFVTTLKQNVFVYGTLVKDLLTLEDTNGISFLLVSSVKKLLDEYSELESEVATLQEIVARNQMIV